MEMEDLHSSKRFCLQNGSGAAGGTADVGRAATAKVRQQERLPEEEEDGEVKSRLGRKVKAMADAAALALHPWLQPPGASRICRVSRASGGKDRHSKVLTAKGLRDRRVRLSVSTAIQFYDLQDRLGYDQPSKAVEWLIKAAAEAISDLPSLNAAFTDQPPSRSQPREEERPFPTAEDGGDAEVAQLEDTDRRQRQEQHQQHISLTKSACSSTSETSKCSVLSLSRSEIRNKARERARERTATAKEKEKDKDGDDDADYASVAHHQVLNLNPPPQSSFIELLTGGGQQNQNHHQGPVTVAQENPLPDFIPKQLRHMPASATFVKSDFFGHVGLFGEGEKPHQPPGFPTQTHINVATATALATGDHPEIQQPQQQFSFMPEHLIPLAATAAGGDYINFSVASGFAGFNRGTLQSNFASPQPNHHLQRLSSPVDGSNLPFFLSSSSQAASASWDGPLAAGFDGRLQRCFDGYRHSDLKGSGKS